LGPRENQPHRIWLRADGKLPDDQLLHVCAVTFASDLNLLDSVLIHHGLAARLDPITMASLDHAMWFHRPFRADEWFLYESESPSASGGRGLATGRFFTRDGRHVASVVQEGLVRLPDA
jgi:acyl-CoA thioesterase-2